MANKVINILSIIVVLSLAASVVVFVYFFTNLSIALAAGMGVLYYIGKQKIEYGEEIRKAGRKRPK